MTETFSFFADLSIVIAVASAVGIFFSRFNLPLTVGYILAGLIVGPHFGPTLIKDSQSIRMLSDFGVMFLMFSIGLGFSFRRVRQMGGRVVFPAIWDVLCMVVGGFFVGKVMGWGNLECFLLGLILCDSSTSIAAKTLESLGWLNQRFAANTFAIALIEDVLAILLIAVLNGISGGSSGAAGADFWTTAAVIGKQLGVLALFLVGVTIFGILLVLLFGFGIVRNILRRRSRRDEGEAEAEADADAPDSEPAAPTDAVTPSDGSTPTEERPGG